MSTFLCLGFSWGLFSIQRLMSKRRWHCRKGEARGSFGVDVMSYHRVEYDVIRIFNSNRLELIEMSEITSYL